MPTIPGSFHQLQSYKIWIQLKPNLSSTLELQSFLSWLLPASDKPQPPIPYEESRIVISEDEC